MSDPFVDKVDMGRHGIMKDKGVDIASVEHVVESKFGRTRMVAGQEVSEDQFLCHTNK